MANAQSASTHRDGRRDRCRRDRYAGPHIALRLTAKLRNNPVVELTLVDRHDITRRLPNPPRVRRRYLRAAAAVPATRRGVTQRPGKGRPATGAVQTALRLAAVAPTSSVGQQPTSPRRGNTHVT